MESTKELLEDLVATEKIANIDLEAWDRRTLASITSTRNDARERVEALKKKYCGIVAESTVGIFVLGSKSQEFAKVAEVDGAVTTISAASLYAKLADLIEPVIGDSREFGIIAMGKLVQGLTDVGHEVGIKSMDLPKFNPIKVKDRAALIDHIRFTVRETLGDDLNRLYLTNAIQEKAYKNKFSGTVLPIVFYDISSTDEAAGLESVTAKFGTRVITSEADEVTKNSVFEAFETVKKKLKSRRTQ